MLQSKLPPKLTVLDWNRLFVTVSGELCLALSLFTRLGTKREHYLFGFLELPRNLALASSRQQLLRAASVRFAHCGTSSNVTGPESVEMHKHDSL